MFLNIVLHILFLLYPASCLIIFNNHDEVWVLATKLQTDIGDPVTKDDLVVGATVIYKSRGKPYEAEILDVKCKSVPQIMT